MADLMGIEPEIKNKFAVQLVAWQKMHGRHDLPWQQTRDPYRVWLSEIMLQQTQVTTVRDYYARFLERFPTVAALAQGSVDEVLGLWSGLGYYSRARNLHRCAQMVMNNYGGQFPQQPKDLMTLPGIGRSTSAAIAAFCFGIRISIFDGNVKRVLARLLAYDKDLSLSRADKELWEFAQNLLPSEADVKRQAQTGVYVMTSYTQGLMDLGASLCLPKRADCKACPVQQVCKAHQQGQEINYPVSSRKVKRSARDGYILWLSSPLGVWLVPRPASGVWGGLYSMPVFDTALERAGVLKNMDIKNAEALPAFKHVLTHMDWTLQPELVSLTQKQAEHLPAKLQEMQGQWFDANAWPELGLPAPIRKLLQMQASSC